MEVRQNRVRDPEREPRGDVKVGLAAPRPDRSPALGRRLSRPRTTVVPAATTRRPCGPGGLDPASRPPPGYLEALGMHAVRVDRVGGDGPEGPKADVEHELRDLDALRAQPVEDRPR